MVKASCTNTEWTVTGSCMNTACTVLPAIPNSLPGNCTLGASEGTTCTPVCNTGFEGTLTGM